MAKKKANKKSSCDEGGSSFALPSGFWAQARAVLLLLLALLLIVTWFQAGGPAIDWVQKEVGLRFFGYANFVLPFILIYLGVAIFRDSNNRLPAYVYVASLCLLVLVASLFDILFKIDSGSGGGLLGRLINAGVLKLVVPNLAAIIYVVLIVVDVFLLAQISISDFIRKLKKRSGQQQVVDKKSEVLPGKTVGVDLSTKPISDFEIHATVPTARINAREKELETTVAKATDTSTKPGTAPQEEKTALVSFQDPNWKTPPISLLGKKQNPADAGDVKANAQIIQDTLHEFGIDVEMTGASIGPKVTQYSLIPNNGVKLSKIAALETNLALNLAAQSLRIEAPIPGKKAVGIEVPNVKSADVRIRGILTSSAWTSSSDKLTFAVGRDTSGQAIVCNLGDLPHVLIAGQTGSGKSVMIDTLLISLLYHNSPSDLKLILVDPKQVGMTPYEGIPHLLTPVITDPVKTMSALKWAVGEMERRYNLLAKYRKKDIKSYNEWINQQNQNKDLADVEEALGDESLEREGAMPYIVVVIDELSDLMMMASRDVEALIVRIAQKARAVGVHLVLATQRPSVNVVTGLIKANVPARFSFTTASQVDSKTILDRAGAEKLLGKGDMLMLTAHMSKPKRVQGAWVSDEEVLKVTDYLRAQMPPNYDETVVSQEVQLSGRGAVVDNFSGSGEDGELLQKAVQIILSDRKASTGYLQRRLRIGYNRAARVMDELEERGVVGPQDGARAREILIDSADDLIL